MTNKETHEQKAKNAYKEINQSSSDEELIKKMCENSELGSEQASVFIKMGKGMSEDEFVDFTMNGEIAPVALTDEELEILQGGLKKSTWVTIGIVASVLL